MDRNNKGPKVINLKWNNSTRPIFPSERYDFHNTMRIDRGTRWGNPFVVGVDGDRFKVVELFEQYAKWRLSIQPDWLKPLKGKNLACWCTPLRCHGDVLLRLANEDNS